MRTIITTVGTSLLTNRNDDRPWAGWRFGSSLPEEADISQWLIDADPRRISAEIHTWYRLGVLDTAAQRKATQAADDQIVLVHSQTPDGKFCAERLQGYAKQHHLPAQVIQVNELNYAKDAKTFNRGLSRLVRVLAETIRAHRPSSDVIIAATGGFKAEIAIANLVGTLLGVPVCYIYEQFEQLITIEPIPIALEPDWLRDGVGKALLHELVSQDCLPYPRVDSYLKADGRLELLIETTDDDNDANKLASLNMLGELAAQLLETPPVDWPEPCDRPPDSKNNLQTTAHHRPKGWQEVVNRLCRSQFVRQVRYDGTAGNQQGFFPAKDSPHDFHVVIADDTAVLGLRVETTAETAAQRQLVMNHLRRTVR
ncbi:MAG: putative CRISPR-associated protein [Synechococcales bacterium]|nr:putative CRISPR-associated protein [Synechococcales bacterium]